MKKIIKPLELKQAFEDGQFSGWAEAFVKTNFWLRMFFPRDLIEKIELNGKEIEERLKKVKKKYE